MKLVLPALRFLFLVFLFLSVFQVSTSAYGDDSRVYVEPDCLKMLGAAQKLPSVEKNGSTDQTYVEEDKGSITFERVTVIEKRDGAVTDAYVQVRNCRVVAPSSN